MRRVVQNRDHGKMDFGKFSVQSQLPTAFAGLYGMYETSGALNISFRLSGIKDESWLAVLLTMYRQCR